VGGGLGISHGLFQPSTSIGSPGSPWQPSGGGPAPQEPTRGMRGCPSGGVIAVSPMPRPYRSGAHASRPGGGGPLRANRPQAPVVPSDACAAAGTPTAACARPMGRRPGGGAGRATTQPTRTAAELWAGFTGVRTFFWQVYAARGRLILTTGNLPRGAESGWASSPMSAGARRAGREGSPKPLQARVARSPQTGTPPGGPAQLWPLDSSKSSLATPKAAILLLTPVAG